jgi:hypothetical protein
VQRGTVRLGTVRPGMAGSFHTIGSRFFIAIVSWDRSSASMPAATRPVGLGSRRPLAGDAYGPAITHTATVTTEDCESAQPKKYR